MVTPLIFNNYTGSGIFFQSSYSFSLQSGTALGLDSWVVTLVSCLGCNQKVCKEYILVMRIGGFHTILLVICLCIQHGKVGVTSNGGDYSYFSLLCRYALELDFDKKSSSWYQLISGFKCICNLSWSSSDWLDTDHTVFSLIYMMPYYLWPCEILCSNKDV
jgi:hypothetical protein